ncbi:hypothetical protein DL93DRAFT_2075811, partial [Clavulina sp. PMI_390]
MRSSQSLHPLPISHHISQPNPFSSAYNTIQPPAHLLHGASPLHPLSDHDVSIGSDNLDDSIIIDSPIASSSSHQITRQKPTEPSPSLRTSRSSHSLPVTFASLRIADERERCSYDCGLLPSYASHLKTTSIRRHLPLNQTHPQRDVEGKAPAQSTAPDLPNWYQSVNARRERIRAIPRPALPEAGLRLRLIRITSATSLVPDLGARMQDLLHREIRAFMLREELALLQHLNPKKNSVLTALPLNIPEGLCSRGRKRRWSGSPDRAVEAIRKKARTTPVSLNSERYSHSRSLDPRRSLSVRSFHRTHSTSLSDEEEDEARGRVWMESLGRRSHPPDLRKALLLHSLTSTLDDPYVMAFR